MKKVVTTVDEFRRALVRLGEAWRVVEYVTAEVPEADDWALGLASLDATDPEPAARRGRGERVTVSVFTAWNLPPFGTEEAPLAALRREVAGWPGVEEVGAAVVDTQLHAIWSFDVVLRLSQ